MKEYFTTMYFKEALHFVKKLRKHGIKCRILQSVNLLDPIVVEVEWKVSGKN